MENFPPWWFLSAPSHQNLAFHSQNCLHFLKKIQHRIAFVPWKVSLYTGVSLLSGHQWLLNQFTHEKLLTASDLELLAKGWAETQALLSQRLTLTCTLHSRPLMLTPSPRLPSPEGCSGCSSACPQRSLQLRYLTAGEGPGTYRCQGEGRPRQGEWGRQGGRKDYSHTLAKTLAPANLLREQLGDMLQVQQQDRNFSQMAASHPDHSNADKSNLVAGLDPVSFNEHRQSFRGILVKTTARQISTLETQRRLGKQTQRCCGIQSAEWRCYLSKVSTLFLPMLFPAVRDGPLAFKTERGAETSKGK